MNQEIQYVRDHRMDPDRYRTYQRAMWIAILGNGLLVIAKGGAAWASGSTAVLATAVDSITDVVYTVLMTWGLWLSQQPADESHPQGHARVEPVIATTIALMMGIAGWEVFRRAIARLSEAPAPFELGLPSVILIGGALVKIVMYLLVKKLAESARSPAIKAAARDNLTDVFSSAVALAGVLGANYLHPLADPIAGALVSLWIFRNVVEILVENLGYLTGRAADPDLVDRIYQVACQVQGVADIHRVVVDHIGPQVRVDMHVNVARDLVFHAAHDIHTEVQKSIEALEEVDQAFIHLEPSSQ